MSKEYKGYTWWTKDWRSSDNIFELDLAQRGLFRELIDSAMLLDNKVPYKPKTWSRMFNCDLPTLLQMIEVLKEMGLICIENDILFIPSCEKRLANKRNGAKGGSVKRNIKRNSKQIGKRNAKQTETETETETETYKQKQETEIENTNRDRSEIKISSPTKENDSKVKSFKKWSLEEFKQDILKNKKNYSGDLLSAFGLYWSEENDKGKMRFQLNTTWSTAGRLATWQRNDEKFGAKKEVKKELNGFEQLMKYTS